MSREKVHHFYFRDNFPECKPGGRKFIHSAESPTQFPHSAQVVRTFLVKLALQDVKLLFYILHSQASFTGFYFARVSKYWYRSTTYLKDQADRHDPQPTISEDGDGSGGGSSSSSIHRVPKKTKQICFCQNFVKFPPISIIFGRKMGNDPNIC